MVVQVPDSFSFSSLLPSFPSPSFRSQPAIFHLPPPFPFPSSPLPPLTSISSPSFFHTLSPPPLSSPSPLQLTLPLHSLLFLSLSTLLTFHLSFSFTHLTFLPYPFLSHFSSSSTSSIPLISFSFHSFHSFSSFFIHSSPPIFFSFSTLSLITFFLLLHPLTHQPHHRRQALLPIEPRATYVFDLRYYDFAWWANSLDAGCYFVTRLKCNTCCANRAAPGHARPLLPSDQSGNLPHLLSSTRRNPFSRGR